MQKLKEENEILKLENDFLARSNTQLKNDNKSQIHVDHKLKYENIFESKKGNNI